MTHGFEDILSRLKPRPVLGDLPYIKADPLRFFERLSNTGRDVVPLHLGRKTVYLLNHPDLIRHVFQERRDDYVRSRYYEYLIPLLGKGLFTLEGEAWKRQRQTAQPGFSGLNLRAMLGAMEDASAAMVTRLGDCAADGQPVDMLMESARLTLDVVMRALFSEKLDDCDAEAVYLALTALLREVERRMWTFLPVIGWLPTRRNRAFRAEVAALDAVVYDLIDRRTASGRKPGDMLDMLIEAETVKGWSGDSRESLRDQVISLLLAGHETGANALSWAIYELSRRPEVLSRVRHEADAVLAGVQEADFSTIGALKYTTAVFNEVLRLYPPAWSMSRETRKPDTLDGHALTPGDTVMICPYIIHRHPGFWDNPLAFDPGRFLDGGPAHKFAFFPFGGGPHACLGNRFAAAEGVLTIARLVRALDFEVLSGQTVEPYPMTTLRPKNGLIVRVHRRRQAEKRTSREASAA